MLEATAFLCRPMAVYSLQRSYWQACGKRPGLPGRFAQEEGRGNADVAAPTHVQLWLRVARRGVFSGEPLPLLM